MKSEREIFEARVKERKPQASFVMRNGRYADKAIQLRWAGWLDSVHAERSDIHEAQINYQHARTEMNTVLAGPGVKTDGLRVIVRCFGYLVLFIAGFLVGWKLL